MNERVSVAEAAKVLGLAPQGVREYMKRGIIDIGSVVPTANGKKNSYRYLIFREKLSRYVGKEI